MSKSDNPCCTKVGGFYGRWRLRKTDLACVKSVLCSAEPSFFAVCCAFRFALISGLVSGEEPMPTGTGVDATAAPQAAAAPAAAGLGNIPPPPGGPPPAGAPPAGAGGYYPGGNAGAMDGGWNATSSYGQYDDQQVGTNLRATLARALLT